MRVTSRRKGWVDYQSGLICDICGKSCIKKDTGPLGDGLIEVAYFGATWGYASRKDGMIWECDLCEDCADKIKEYIASLGGKIQETYYG